MSRSVHLLVDVLRDTQDFKMLLNLSIQLRDMPELDKYVKSIGHLSVDHACSCIIIMYFSERY